MTMDISLSPLSALLSPGTAVVLQDGEAINCLPLCEMDEVSGGQIARAMKAARFCGKKDDVLVVTAPAGMAVDRLILVGTEGAVSPLDRRRLGAKIATLPEVLAAGDIRLFAPDGTADLLRGMALRAYSFDVYRKPQPVLRSVAVCGGDAALEAALPSLRVEVDAVHFARDLVNEPANRLPPLEMAARIAAAGGQAGVDVRILPREELEQEGFGLLLGVGQGSVNPPCVVVMRLGKGETLPLAFVGKGVCFDTGGVNVKPVAGMWEMKGDMAGAAAAAAAMLALGRDGYQGDIVAVLGLAENMTGGSAIRPGDILTAYSGQTVEVRNTDCEGRLILADCLSYAQRALGATKVIDVATLTYAVQIGLGTRYAGVYGNARAMIDAVQQAAAAACEKVWPMPIDSEFHAELKSDFADMLNWPGVTYGNASIAAAFLEEFIEEATEWAHIDIAGPGYAGAGTAFAPPGGTGFCVETLLRLVQGV